MDRRVKERLVGASILAVLIVLIVPELLSGPPGPVPAAVSPRLPVRAASEPVRNVTVDLATSKAPEPDPAAAETAASSSAPPPEAPPSEDGASADAPPAETSHAAPAPSTESSGPVETASPAPTSVSPAAPNPPITVNPPVTAKPPLAAKAAIPAGRPWAVQLGSFASRANADKLERQLKARGFSVYIVPGGSGTSLRYRVRIGPMADRGTATQTLAKLKSAGQAGSLVAPAP
jgi:DedD protein